MDKEWVWKNRLSREYSLGVESFMQFARQNVDDLNQMPCPCVSCGNLRRLKFDQVRAHLLWKGMDKLYTQWIWHGEWPTKRSSMSNDNTEGQKNHTSFSREPLDDMVHASYESSEASNEYVEKLEDDDETRMYPKRTKFTDLVHLQRPKAKKMEPEVKKPILDKESVPIPLYILYCCSKAMSTSGHSITVCLDNDVLGIERTFNVEFEDINAFSRLQPISTACIVVYIRHLYIRLIKNKVHQFRFLDPWYMECFPSTKKDDKSLDEQIGKMARALTNRLIGISSDQLLLVPCNIGGHWNLAIINPNKEEVCLMDPLHRDNHNDVSRQVVDLVSRVFIARSASKKARKAIAWKVIKGPKSRDSSQCGFYVLRYMKQITEFDGRVNTDLMQSMFTQDHYSEVEIDEVRTEWADCVWKYVVA